MIRRGTKPLGAYSLRQFRGTAAETWRLSQWLVAQQGISWLGASGHGLILTALLGPASFGVYRAAYQVVNLLNPFRQAATNHLPSKAARIFAAQGPTVLANWSLRIVVTLGIPFFACALLVALFAQPLATFMYGSTMKFSDLQFIVALGALAYALNFARTPIDFAVLVAGGARALFLRTLYLNVFVLTGGVLLIRHFEIIGALVSEIITAVLATLLTIQLYASLRRPPCLKSTAMTPTTAGSVP